MEKVLQSTYMTNRTEKIHTTILLVANSTPIVDFDSKLNSFLVNLDNKLLLPTPESPISTTVKRKIIKTHPIVYSSHK